MGVYVGGVLKERSWGKRGRGKEFFLSIKFPGFYFIYFEWHQNSIRDSAMNPIDDFGLVAAPV